MIIAITKIAVRSIIYATILLFFLIPSLINVKNSHSWGDDFSQYIYQAKNFLEHRPIDDIGVIFDNYTLNWGSPRYVPMGFPLILSFFYYLFGNSIFHFNILMSIIYFLFGLFLFLYLKFSLSSNFKAFILTGLIIYNPWFIDFKTNILSDLPFLLFIIISLLCLRDYLPKRVNLIRFLITTFIITFTLSIRVVSPTITLAIFFTTIALIINNRRLTPLTISYLLVIILATTFNFLLHHYLFNLNEPSGYFQRNLKNPLTDISLSRYITPSVSLVRTIQSLIFIPSYFPNYSVNIIFFLIIGSILLGAFFKLKSKGLDISDFFFVSYFLLLFYLKVSGSQGFRYLLPLVPGAIEYVGFLIAQIKSKYQTTIIYFILFFVIFSYLPATRVIIAKQSLVTEGPQAPSAIDAFSYIHTNLSPDSVIVFRKPHALTLYTGIKTHPIIICNPSTPAIIKTIETEYAKFNTQYFLYDTYFESQEESRVFKAFLKQSSKVTPLWNNQRFYLYKFINS